MSKELDDAEIKRYRVFIPLRKNLINQISTCFDKILILDDVNIAEIFLLKKCGCHRKGSKYIIGYKNYERKFFLVYQYSKSGLWCTYKRFNKTR